jgi:hypothetical protein
MTNSDCMCVWNRAKYNLIRLPITDSSQSFLRFQDSGVHPLIYVPKFRPTYMIPYIDI